MRNLISQRAQPILAMIAILAATPSAPTHAQDVKALCERVANDDRVRPIPITLVPAARQAFSLPGSASEIEVQKSTSFRCKDKKVWLCNTGANLVCGKANVSRASAGAANFCKQNPNADIVPMAATGHDTIYEWKCSGNKAIISKEIVTLDPAGFIAENWKPAE
ncbi:MAG TPA: hypothetical protein VEK34_13135 [Methylocella sp.]|nr:hypothetical protein [Methylocella sp.]